ncbi:hypothetical protein P0Y35_16045 [Kiritimatiellaeota bacterium B1221]|nr:hypothetical protein [Kiritimatiellaeota bacterium B1221]
MNSRSFRMILVCLGVMAGGSLSAQRITSMMNAGRVFGDHPDQVQLVHLAEKPGEDVISPQHLFVRFGPYSLLSVEGKTEEGMPRKLKFSAGQMRIWFTFDKGQSSVRSTNKYTSHLTLFMLDREGNPAGSNVAFYELRSDWGERWRFAGDPNVDAFGSFISFTNVEGTEFRRESLGVSVLKDGEGAIRALHTPVRSFVVKRDEGLNFSVYEYDASDMMVTEDPEDISPQEGVEPVSVNEFRKITQTKVSIWYKSASSPDNEAPSYFSFNEKKRSWEYEKAEAE